MSASLFDIGSSWEKPNGTTLNASIQPFSALSEGDKVYLYDNKKETITEGFVKKPKYQYKEYWLVKITEDKEEIIIRMNNSEADSLNLYYSDNGYVCTDYDELFKYVYSEHESRINYHRDNLKFFSDKLETFRKNNRQKMEKESVLESEIIIEYCGKEYKFEQPLGSNGCQMRIKFNLYTNRWSGAILQDRSGELVISNCQHKDFIDFAKRLSIVRFDCNGYRQTPKDEVVATKMILMHETKEGSKVVQDFRNCLFEVFDENEIKIKFEWLM